MSISNVQRKRKIEEFQTQLLKKGIAPNTYELNKMLTEYFDNHIMGMPYYSPINQEPYEESSKANYNHNFLTFKEDIETAYEANIETNNKAVAMQEYYELEINKVRNAIAKLQLRVENITEALKGCNKVKQYVEVFDDLYKTEFYGNTARNIPYTTAFVDLLQKKVYTDKTSTKTNKISMVNAKITLDAFQSAFGTYKISGDLNKVLNDTLNDIFIIEGQSQQEEEKKFSIIIDLCQFVEINMVSFSFTSIKEMPCELLLSDDGENYISVYDQSSRNYIEWNFNSKKIRYIKLVLHKTEADGITVNDIDEEAFQYYYVLKNISIAKEEFQEQSVYVSKLIDFDDLTSIIKLDATDMIFNNTRIDYFIGFDNGKDKIGWDAIENHKDHELFMFEKRHKILNSSVDEAFGSLGETIDLYKLYELPPNINKNSIKLIPAYNMWSVKRYKRFGGDSNEDGFTLAMGDFSDLTSRCYMEQLFMDCENYDTFDIDTNVLYIFTQYLRLDESQNSYNHFMQVINQVQAETGEDAIVKATTEIRVFLNGYEVVKDDYDKYSFAFRKGTNKIQIAIYCSNSNAVTYKLYHNFNFKPITNDVFGFPAMRYTSNTILETSVGQSYNYYTIKDNWIYVKCDPNDMIKRDDEDMGYFLTYSALRNDMVNYFKSNHLQFRIMAVLVSNDRNVSPEILNFRLTGK